MSKNIKTTALVLVLLLAFLCGFGMGKNRGFNLNYNTNPTGTTAPAEAKPVTITTEPQADSTDKPAADTAKIEVKPAPKKAPTTPKDVVAAYNNAVNTAKQREKLTIVKTRTLDLTPGDTKPSMAKGAVKSALEKAVQPLDETTFTVDKDSRLLDVRNGVHSEATHPLVYPVVGNVVQRLPDLRILPVKIWLGGCKGVEIILLARFTPRPGGFAEYAAPVGGFAAVGLCIPPNIPVTVGIIPALHGFQEPFVLI